jgi:nucleotidyltransferase/DNA polymerase involved in DNA repair
MQGMPITKIPSLGRKAGAQVTSELGITLVGQLPAFPRHQLEQRFGAATAALLARLPLAVDDAPVRERGPQKSILCERSCPPLTRCGGLRCCCRCCCARACHQACAVRRGAWAAAARATHQPAAAGPA